MPATRPVRRWALALGVTAFACSEGAAKLSGNYDSDTNNGEGDTNEPSTTGAATTTAGTGGPPPEMEDEGDFRVPKASGKYVYSASEEIDAVAVIDTATLAIDVV